MPKTKKSKPKDDGILHELKQRINEIAETFKQEILKKDGMIILD